MADIPYADHYVLFQEALDRYEYSLRRPGQPFPPDHIDAGTVPSSHSTKVKVLSVYSDILGTLQSHYILPPYHPKTQTAIAYGIAQHVHAAQTRHDGITPYLTHPVAVMHRLSSKNDNENAICLLHDVLEDSDWTAQQLLDNGIAPEVVEGVVVLTKLKGESYTDFLVRIKPHDVPRRIKIVDMLCNLADDPTEKQIRKYAKGLQFLYEN